MGIVGIASIARLDQADVLVTDAGMDISVLEVVRDAVPNVIVAEVPDKLPPAVIDDRGLPPEVAASAH